MNASIRARLKMACRPGGKSGDGWRFTTRSARIRLLMDKRRTRFMIDDPRMRFTMDEILFLRPRATPFARRNKITEAKQHWRHDNNQSVVA